MILRFTQRNQTLIKIKIVQSLIIMVKEELTHLLCLIRKVIRKYVLTKRTINIFDYYYIIKMNNLINMLQNFSSK